MKGFLQKMAYTMQSIIMYAAFSITGYNGEAAVQTAAANSAISFLMFIVPPVMIVVSLIVFLKKHRQAPDRERFPRLCILLYK